MSSICQLLGGYRKRLMTEWCVTFDKVCSPVGCSFMLVFQLDIFREFRTPAHLNQKFVNVLKRNGQKVGQLVRWAGSKKHIAGDHSTKLFECHEIVGKYFFSPYMP